MAVSPDNYSRAQIWLHWIVVLGIITQIAVHEPIVRMMAALHAGDTPAPADVTLANMHVMVGITIFVAVLARLWLRFRRGVPAHPPEMPSLQGKLASFVHVVFYVLLLAMVVTGMLTKNQIVDLGQLHFAINITIFFLALGHAAAALFNQFIRKDGTLSRMNPFKRRTN